MKISNVLTLPPESIFSLNHLNYVMSTESNIRNYLVQALEIDGSFIDKFSVHDWVSALEHTLIFRPAEVPTEIYLKSQSLWIMHKLLMRIDSVRDKIQFLLASSASLPQISGGRNVHPGGGGGGGGLTPEEQVELQNVKVGLGQLLLHFQTRLTREAGAGSGDAWAVSDDLIKALHDFQHQHQAILQVEKKVHVERRCEIIRWCAWCLCTYGREWLERCDVNLLQNGFYEWMTNRPMLLSFHRPQPSSASSASSLMGQPIRSPGKSVKVRVDSPAVVRKVTSASDMTKQQYRGKENK